MSNAPQHSGSDKAASDRTRKESARRVAIGILAAVAALLAIVNLEEVQVDLVVASVTMPLIIVIVGCLLIGGVIGAYLSRRGRRKS